MKKATLWLGTMDFRGYDLHVISKTEAGVKKALLKEYKRHEDTDLKNPTFDELQEWIGVHVQEMPFDEVIWP